MLCRHWRHGSKHDYSNSCRGLKSLSHAANVFIFQLDVYRNGYSGLPGGFISDFGHFSSAGDICGGVRLPRDQVRLTEA